MTSRQYLNRALLAFVGCCLAPIVWPKPPTLCKSEEQILFACSTGKKLVSVCASKDLSRTAGYAQYRFGALGRRPELIFPEQKVQPASNFSYGATGSAKSSLENLEFTLAGYSYTIYRQAAAFDEEGAGIGVKAPDGNSRRLRCNESSPQSNLGLLDSLGLRKLPEEALVDLENFEVWPAESPNVDLLVGVRSHDLTLVERALANGADVNFHGPYDSGVLGAVADERWEAIRPDRVAVFDQESDQILAVLLSHGALPRATTANGSTAFDSLVAKGAVSSARTLLDAGWPSDYGYRLYAGVLLADPALVKQALDHGAEPNGRSGATEALKAAIGRAGALSGNGTEREQADGLAALELLLVAGAHIDEGTPRSGGGDIVTTYAYFGQTENVRPLLDLLVRYATPAARINAENWLRIVKGSSGNRQRDENEAWLLKRLGQG